MYAGTSVSPAQGPFDAAALIHQQPRQSARSNSLSSGSVVTIRRPASISRVRSESPTGDGALIPLRLGRNSISSDHGRAQSVSTDHYYDQTSIAPPLSSSGDVPGMSSVNRWSHSTTSSVASPAHNRRHRSSSSGGTVLSSTRNSPQKSRRRQSTHDSQAASLSAIPPWQTTPALTDPNDTESPSTTQTVSTPPVLSPSRQDYFGGDEGLAQYGMAKTQQRVVMVRNQTAPVPVKSRTMGEDTAHHSSSASRGENEQKAKRDGDHRRTRERTEKDKKAMLSKALQKANTAVLLDNAQNYEGALEAYGDACELLGQVMDRTSGDDDKRKLDAIRVTYSNRMEELHQLVEEMPIDIDEKDLPARPMSAESQPLSPNSSVLSRTGIEDALHEDAVSPISLAPAPVNAPRLSYARNDRDSFFSRTMAAVENSTGFQSDSQEEVRSDASAVAGAEDVEDKVIEGGENRVNDDLRLGRKSIHLPPSEMDQYMPRPLSPRRAQPTAEQSHADNLWDREEHQPQIEPRARSRSNSKDSVSWLDTIDESASSCSDSVHSFSSQQEVRRKHIRGISGVTDPDFDAAFDAAVEAAYDEGLEPDTEARTKQMAAYRQTQNESVHLPASELDEIIPGALQTSRVMVPDPDDEEEERILDEMTNEYGQGFNFDLQTKSALPRQSDSSGYSRSTWQSSTMSDRATAATSLSTVAEDGLAHRFSQATPLGSRIDPAALPPATAPPRGSLPPPPNAGNSSRLSTVRSRRLSNINSKQLKIETASQPEARKRASTFHHTSSPFQEEHTDKESSELDSSVEQSLSSSQHDHLLRSPPSLELHTASDNTNMLANSTVTDFRPSYEPVPGELHAARPNLFRKNKSTASLRDHPEHTILLASPDPEANFPAATPMSTTFMSFAARRNHSNPLTSQRATLPSSSGTDSHMAGGIYLFDTSLSAAPGPVSPRSPNTTPQPNGLEPCPESFLLRPFWLMRALSSTIIHPKGGFLTTKTFVPREVWQSTGVKLKVVEDKIANCDLLTAALGRLAGVDTYDADAIMDELQSFEEVMERVQAALSKKLGSEVGVHGVAGMFKDASAANVASAMGNTASDHTAASDKATKSNSGKSYLSSWRKLRSKSSGTPLSTGSQIAAKPVSGKDQHTMPSVPMTNFVPVERRGNKRDARNLVFEGPNKEYMGSLARLFDGVQVLGKSANPSQIIPLASRSLAQMPASENAALAGNSPRSTSNHPTRGVLSYLIVGHPSLTHCVFFATDQIARQVEDPGLKHSSPTHVGLELSIRHAAEFFGFYVCRFVLADLGLLMDKFVKKGTEWVLA